LDRGFSVNIPAELTRLERRPASQIIAALGKQRARVARTPEEIEVRIGLARRGQELFPIVIVLVALVLAAEHWLANRFYQAAASRTAPARPGDMQTRPGGKSDQQVSFRAAPSNPLPVTTSHSVALGAADAQR
jgi:hypothetical protein